ncbi:hypothetical protein QQF64_023692 [Cirrhinus molitorella]|uniref:Cleavage and polyadenylation specificity factor subunit 2 n=1 Tax=Cirrhinus molitorella TaxID=172907 RepID=A0ABR3NJ74_9TELE
MTSIIKLTALSVVQEESALCYLLQVRPTVDAVAALSPRSTFIWWTLYRIPVGKMGSTATILRPQYPFYKMANVHSRHNTEDFTLFTLDDVDSAFDKIQQLKYSQIVNLKVKDGEEEIIYAVDFNHKREIHLNGCSLETISRPSLLITDPFNAYVCASLAGNTVTSNWLTNVMETLRGDGNVLISVDTAGRVLELAQLLDQIWRTKDAGLVVYSTRSPMLNNVSYNVVEFSKSQVSLS